MLYKRHPKRPPVSRWQKLSGATREVTAPAPAEEVIPVARKPVPHMECGDCQDDFPLTPENALVARFSEEAEYDYLLAMCDCGSWNRNFINDSTIGMLLGRGIPLVQERYAPPEVVSSYLAATNTPLIMAHDLSPSEEHLVEYFRWVLDRGDQS